MTDGEKLNIIKQWIDESIAQGNAPIIVHAINSILKHKEPIQSPIKLSKKSLDILKKKEKI